MTESDFLTMSIKDLLGKASETLGASYSWLCNIGLEETIDFVKVENGLWVRCVDHEGGHEGAGEYEHYVIEIKFGEQTRLARLIGFYDSYGGSSFDNRDWQEVKEYKVIYTKYLTEKESTRYNLVK